MQTFQNVKSQYIERNNIGTVDEYDRYYVTLYPNQVHEVTERLYYRNIELLRPYIIWRDADRLLYFAPDQDQAAIDDTQAGFLMGTGRM